MELQDNFSNIVEKKLPLPKLQYPTKYSYLKQAQALLLRPTRGLYILPF